MKLVNVSLNIVFVGLSVIIEINRIGQWLESLIISAIKIRPDPTVSATVSVCNLQSKESLFISKGKVPHNQKNNPTNNNK